MIEVREAREADADGIRHAIPSDEVRAATIRRDELLGPVRTRPDIGVVPYRNLALGLGAKLWRADPGDRGGRPEAVEE
ncbi:MAG: hypothetical protein R3199_05925 [Gemmatimonadota bacterium]|nr:hypothetical protein [Gemmatimonadota bacterium]